MTKAKKGDKVKIHYTGKLDSGEIFDSSKGRDPIEFKLGEGSVIPKFEENIIGMSPGESKSFRINSEDAYGSLREELIIEVPKEHLPDTLKPELGMELMIEMQEGGGGAPVQIIAISEKTITLDANHPLAGEDLNFEITLVEVV